MNKFQDIIDGGEAQTQRDMDSIHRLHGKAFTVVRRVKGLECLVDALDLVQKDHQSVLLDGEQALAIVSGIWDAVDAARELDKAFSVVVDAHDERANSDASVATAGADPLLAFIERWEAEEKACAALSDSDFDAEWDRRNAPFAAAAKEGTLPRATTAAGAASALRRALRDADLSPSERGQMNAALSFLEAAA